MFGLFAWRGTAPRTLREQARPETRDLLGIKLGEHLLAARGGEHILFIMPWHWVALIWEEARGSDPSEDCGVNKLEVTRCSDTCLGCYSSSGSGVPPFPSHHTFSCC